MVRIPHWETYEGLNSYDYAYNEPIAYVDSNGLWTIGVGLWGGSSIWGAGGLSGGFYFGHGPGGWSFGFLGTGFLGAGGFGLGGGGFLQFTTAPCVSTLKGPGGTAGGSAGEGPSLGGAFDYGNGYVGGQLNFGFGIGTPIQIQGGGTYTVGPTWGK